MEVTVRDFRLVPTAGKKPCAIFCASNTEMLTDVIELIKSYQDYEGKTVDTTLGAYQRLYSDRSNNLPDLTQPGYTYFIIKLSSCVYRLTGSLRLDGLCGVKIVGEKKENNECTTVIEGTPLDSIKETQVATDDRLITMTFKRESNIFPTVYVENDKDQDARPVIPNRMITIKSGWQISTIAADGEKPAITITQAGGAAKTETEQLYKAIIKGHSILVVRVLWLSYKLKIANVEKFSVEGNEPPIYGLKIECNEKPAFSDYLIGCPVEVWNILPQGADDNKGKYYFDVISEGLDDDKKNEYIRVHYLCNNEEEYNSLKATPDKLRVSTITQFADIQNCAGICLENICFRHCGIYDILSSSLSQAEATSGGCIKIRKSDHVIIRGCEFTRIGGYTVKADESTRVQLRENYVHDTYGGGFHLNLCHNCVIDDNLVRDFGNYQEGSVGILLRDAYTNNVTHNTIFNGWYTGVSVGWQWGYATSKSYDNYIAYNHIHHCMRMRLNDGGGIYCLGISPGTVIENNVIHDIVSTKKNDASAIYLDEGSSYIKVRNNVCFGCNVGLHQHYGKANEIYNNLFAFTNDSCAKLSRAERHLSLFAHNNILKVGCGVVFNTAPHAIADFHDNVLDKTDIAVYIPAREYVRPYRLTSHSVDFTCKYIEGSAFLYYLSLKADYMIGREIMSNTNTDFVPFDVLPETSKDTDKPVSKDASKPYGVQNIFLKEHAIMAKGDIVSQQYSARVAYPHNSFFELEI